MQYPPIDPWLLAAPVMSLLCAVRTHATRPGRAPGQDSATLPLPPCLLLRLQEFLRGRRLPLDHARSPGLAQDGAAAASHPRVHRHHCPVRRRSLHQRPPDLHRLLGREVVSDKVKRRKVVVVFGEVGGAEANGLGRAELL